MINYSVLQQMQLLPGSMASPHLEAECPQHSPGSGKSASRRRLHNGQIIAFLLCSIPECCPLTHGASSQKPLQQNRVSQNGCYQKRRIRAESSCELTAAPGFCDAAFPPVPGVFPIRAISHTTNISQRSSVRPKPSGDGVQCASTTLTGLHGADSLILAA